MAEVRSSQPGPSSGRAPVSSEDFRPEGRAAVCGSPEVCARIGRAGWLRRVRVAVGVLVLGAFVWVFTDVRELAPAWLGRLLPRTQFVPALLGWTAGSGVAVAALVILAVTLLCGRAYCAAFCPLGLYQDAVWWVRRKLLGSRRVPFSPEAARVRSAVFWFCLGGAVVSGGVMLAWLDPYSGFGRIAALWFRPLFAWLTNAAVDLLGALGVEGLYRVAVPWHWGWGTGLAAGLLFLVTGLAAWRGRLYCNTVCPVGTLLGWLARRARWQLQLQPAQCRKCARCLEACKAQCIDLRHQTVDFSRCVLCFNCMATCPEQGMRWVRGNRGAPGREAGSGRGVAAPDRRRFLGWVWGLIASGPLLWGARAHAEGETGHEPAPAGGGSAPRGGVPVTPPGSVSQRHFLRHCTACGLCVAACPTRVLQPAGFEYGWAGLMRPHMDYPHAFCNYDCHRCGEVCPTGAIRSLPLAEKQRTKIGEAELTLERCVVVKQGTDCAACSEHCPTQAVTTKPYRDHLRVPELHPQLCIGCGACEYACPVRPVRAIVVRGWAEHGRAEKWRDTPPPNLPGTGDFPF